MNDTLDTTFAALADPVRRSILGRLAGGPRPVSELAEPFAISLPGVLKHLRALEAAGLITTEKRGRVRTCTLQAGPLREAAAWLAVYQRFWSARFDSLERHLRKGATKEKDR